MTESSVFVLPIEFILTIFIFSFLYKENRLFRLAEHLAVGAAAGHVVLTGIGYITNSGIKPIMLGNFIPIIPIILGIVTFGAFSRRYSWTSRYPTALMAGVGMGLSIRGAVKASLIDQIIAAITLPQNPDLLGVFNYVLGALIVITSLSYFIFTREQKGILRFSSKLGRYFMLAGLGVGYVSFMLGRNTMLIARLAFLVETVQKWFFAG